MPSISEIVSAIKSAKIPGEMRTKIVAVDGPGGAGKSTLAKQLGEALDNAPIVQTDDFASWDNPLNWYPRLLEQVLKPLSLNKPAHYQRYDWGSKSLAEWHDIEPPEYLILEGVSASRKAFRPYLAYSIWIETPREERLRRGLERDGEEAREQWNKWMAEEDHYIAEEKPQENADVVISGAARQELKIKVEDYKKIEELLTKAGAVFLYEDTSTYTYFNQPEDKVLKTTENSKGASRTVIERKGDRFNLSENTPLKSSEATKRELEKEFGIKKVLKNIRRYFDYGDFTLTTNQIEGVGQFLIIEGLSPSLEIVQKLGIKNPEIITNSFDNL